MERRPHQWATVWLDGVDHAFFIWKSPHDSSNPKSLKEVTLSNTPDDHWPAFFEHLHGVNKCFLDATKTNNDWHWKDFVRKEDKALSIHSRLEHHSIQVYKFVCCLFFRLIQISTFYWVLLAVAFSITRGYSFWEIFNAWMTCAQLLVGRSIARRI